MIRSKLHWAAPLLSLLPARQKLKAALVRLQGDKPVNPSYPDGWADKIGELFRTGNQALIERYGLPLDRYGYPV